MNTNWINGKYGYSYQNAPQWAAVKKAVANISRGYISITTDALHDETKNARDFAPLYIPDGYGFVNIEEYGPNCLFIYEDADGNKIILSVVVPDIVNVDNEYHTYKRETRGGVIYHIHEATAENRLNIVHWEREGHLFIIDALLSVEEIFKVIDSIEYNG